MSSKKSASEIKTTPQEIQDTTVNRRGFLRLSLGGVLIAGSVAGCGGGSGKGGPSGSDERGRMQITIHWPEVPAGASRYLPMYAQSVVLVLTSVQDPSRTYRKIASRAGAGASAQTISFDDPLRVGPYRLSASATAEGNGAGAQVAAATVDVNVVLNQTAKPALTLASTLKSLAINGLPVTVAAGRTTTMTATATDATNATVLLPTTALSWTQLSGGNLGTLSASGVFTAKRDVTGGSARVRVEEKQANLSAEADIAVLPVPPPPKVVVSMYLYDLRRTARSPQASVATGKLKWKFQTGDYIFGSPVIDGDGVLYIASNDHKLYALNTKTGAKKWDASLPGNAMRSNPALGPDGVLYIGGGEKSGKVYAFDMATGAKVWERQTGVENVTSSPALASDGTLYIGAGEFNKGKMLALDSLTGQIKWSFDTGGEVSGSPAIGTDGTIYFGRQFEYTSSGQASYVYALDGATGAKKWEFRNATSSPGFEMGPSIGSDGTVYIAARSFVGETPDSLYALNGANGQVKWKFTAFDTRGCPCIGDGVVYQPAGDGSVYALNAANGTKKWEFQTGGECVATPTLDATGTLYFGSKDTNLYAVNAATGVEKWRFATEDYVFSTPAIGEDGVLYFTSFDGNVYALE